MTKLSLGHGALFRVIHPLLVTAVGAVIAPRALAPFLQILVISPLDGVCGDPKTEGHIVVSIRRCIFDQHELFQEIETNNPAVDLEVAAVNAGRNDGKIDYELGLGSTLRIFSHLLQTPAQKIAASAMMRTACSMGAAVRPKGPNGAHRSFQSDQ